MATIKEKVEIAEEQTNIDPTDGQKNKGNYKKGRVTIKGLKVVIENPAGTTRSGISKDGKVWSSKQKYSYGYFGGTIGKDGDPIDVYLGPIVDEDFDVYVIDQVDEETRAFDEHKIMFGFEDADKAKESYLSCFEDTWTGFNSITKMSLKKFKQWLKNADAIKWPASKLSMGKKMIFRNSINPKMKTIQLSGEVLDDVTLKNLKDQAGDENNFDTLIVEIASPGGSVSEGLMIMVWLDQLSQSGKEIITVVTANAYSIASLIMLAADHKMISKHGEVMVHNPMVPELKYANATELEKYALELRELESIMYELYQIFTGLTPQEIKNLMDNETYLSPEDSIKNGFADIMIDIEPKQFEMIAINSKKEINMSKTLNILNRVIGMVKKADFVNQLYYDNEGGEIEIFQNDPSTYAVGDRSNIADGEVVLSDGSKLTIIESVITEIDKSVEEVAKDEIVEEVATEEVVEEVVAAEEIAPIVEEAIEIEEIPAKSKDAMPGKVIETTESTVSTKETIAKAVVEDDKVAVVNGEFNEGNAPEKMVATEVEEKMVATEVEGSPDMDMMAMLAKIEVGMNALTSKFSQLNDDNAEMKTKMTNMSKFEEVATEAIDALASASASSFTPEARAQVQTVVPSGSIFQSMLKKRGLS